MGKCKLSIAELMPELAVVVVEWLQILVDISNGAGEAQVEGPQNANILVILVLDELDDDVLVGLDLQHLEREAEERGGLAVAAVGPAGVVELHSLVDQRLGGEAEALLLPVGALVDLGAHNLLHQVLRVRPVDALREGVRAVRHHFGNRAPRSPLAGGGGCGCVVVGIGLGFANKTLAGRARRPSPKHEWRPAK